MSATAVRPPTERVSAVALIGMGICSVQFGAAIAVKLFDRTGAGGTVLLRLFFAAVILVAIWRPRFTAYDRRQWRLLICFGVAFAAMNLSFYEAIDRIPIGIAVAIEFVGPLSVSVLSSRRPRDLVAVVLAGLGVLALTRGGSHGVALDGVILVLCAAAAWAAYILLTARVGQEFTDGSGLAVAMSIATLLVLVPGVIDGGSHLLEPHSLLIGAGVAVLSSVIPYSVEMAALRRLDTGLFGVLMSLEPAVAALAGLIVLGQGLSGRQWVGIALVAFASAWASVSSMRSGAEPVVEPPAL